jgi:hypothetical protein
LREERYGKNPRWHKALTAVKKNYNPILR